MYDEWIVGEGLEAPGRWYVLHTAEPMFLAEIWDEAEAPVGGLSWSLANGQVVGNVTFFSEELPSQSVIDTLVLQIGAIMDDYDERVERRIARGRRELDDD